jgi:hypothetical protein
MRTRAAGVTAAVAVLSVLASAAGHALVAGHPVPSSVLPRLGLLASLCFLFATQRLRTPVLVAALSLVQVGVHVVLTAAHPVAVGAAQPTNHAHHQMASMEHMHQMAAPAVTPHADHDLPMLALHLGAMLGTLALLHAAARWWEQLVSALGRALPRWARIVIVRPARSPAYAVLPTPRPQRWLPSTVRRRGPPAD